jgi:predicted polyphosphate/ATP-dependent NAD kinase
MQYRVYSGPKGSGDVSPFEKSHMLFKEFAILDDALSWARHLEDTGRVVLLIEGGDGTQMNRRDIVDALRVGMREQLDK